jgi:SAM-dependent methyltransferase
MGHDGGVPAYADFAKFYDEIMGDRSSLIERVRGYVRRYLPDAGSLLELGCGTGAVLAGLADGLQVTGIDLSPQMLATATANLPGVRLVQADITDFSLSTRFDVVICVFDTLNHLPSFDAWLAMFGQVDAHLAEGGLFVFDVNTVGRLRRLAAAPAYVEDFGPHTLVMDVTTGEGGVFPWDVRIFERVREDRFRLHHERIGELGVPLARIHEALTPHFELLEATDTEGRPANDESDRAYFVYRHRAAPGEGTPDDKPWPGE